MKKLAILMIILAAIYGCSSSAIQFREDVPADESLSDAKTMEEEKIIPAVTPRYVDIWLDMGENELGAYHLILHYNEKVVSIHEVLPSPYTSPGSTTSPLSKPEAYTTGMTAIVGLIPGRQGPKGRIHIAHVLFTPVETGKSAVSVSIKSLYDPQSKPVTGVVELSSTELDAKK